MHRRPPWGPLIIALGVAVLSGGCAGLDRIETKVDEVAATTNSLQREQKVATRDLEEIHKALQAEGITSVEERAELLARFAAMERKMGQIEARMEDQQGLLSRLQASVDLLTRRPSVPAPAARSATGPDETAPADTAGTAAAAVDTVPAAPPLQVGGSPGAEVYDAAFGDFTRGSYTLAREGFQEFLARYPDSDLADNAAYWMGETWYAQGNYREALDRFEAVLRQHPDGDIIPAALLKASNCRLEVGQSEQALEGYRRLLRDYPESDEAFIARHKLEEAGAAP